MSSTSSVTTRPFIVSQAAIPNLSHIQVDGDTKSLGMHRDFRRHPLLRDFIPESGRLSISWTGLQPGEQLDPHQHPTPSMIVVYRGTGELIGDISARIAIGDVVAVPIGAIHGFIGGTPDGLHALSIQFEGTGLYENTDSPRVAFHTPGLEALKTYHASRLTELLQSGFIRLLHDGTLDDSESLQRFLRYLNVWSRDFQQMMFQRQASCDHPDFYAIFRKHLAEEYGHDELLTTNPVEQCWDPILASTGSWFRLQMSQLDNIEKMVVIHMVLEGSAHAFYEHAMARFRNTPHQAYFATHAEADEGHSEMGMHMLHNLTEKQYTRLRQVVEQAWDMHLCTLERISELTRHE